MIDQNIQPSEVNNTQAQPRQKFNVYGINFLIFFGYIILAIIFANISNNSDSSSFILFFGYMIHAALLICLSVIYAIIGFTKKIKTNAGHYFVCAILLLIVGFGTCTATLSSGIVNLF